MDFIPFDPETLDEVRSSSDSENRTPSPPSPSTIQITGGSPFFSSSASHDRTEAADHLVNAAAEMAQTVGDNWTAQSYQQAAAFVPQLATKVIQWLDVQQDDYILDIGCGDGIITRRIAEQLTDGYILGIDSSPAMIAAAVVHFGNTPFAQLRYKEFDASTLFEEVERQERATEQRALMGVIENEILDLTPGAYTKIFSNAALHWIISHVSPKWNFFLAIHKLLRPGGTFVFEMGGHGNVAEMHAALVSAVAHRRGIDVARRADVDPWFFPDEAWMIDMLDNTGFVIEMMETEHRPTKATTGLGGGIGGWVRLMGKTFIDAVAPEEREVMIKEVCDVLWSVCTREDGTKWMGYVRLRVKARKPL